jgi:hypothetical protein
MSDSAILPVELDVAHEGGSTVLTRSIEVRTGDTLQSVVNRACALPCAVVDAPRLDTLAIELGNRHGTAVTSGSTEIYARSDTVTTGTLVTGESIRGTVPFATGEGPNELDLYLRPVLGNFADLLHQRYDD